MPVIGGLVADRFLGFRRAVTLGAVLLCLGHLGMAFEGTPAVLTDAGIVRDEFALQILYLSLALIIVGVGLLKPNISSIVGELYANQDGRRDAGFTIFYMGINLGAVLAALTCGYLGETYGWAYGFGLAGLGMLVGLITFIRGKSLLEGKGEAPSDERLQSVSFGLTLHQRIIAGVVVAVCAAWWFMQHHTVVGTLLTLTTIGAIGGVLVYIFMSCTPEERKSMGLLLFLTAYSVIFWALFEQAGSSLNLFADRNVDRTLFGLSMTASQLQFFNPGFIILLAPLFSVLWQWLASRGWEPSSSAKFGLGVLQAGLGFLLLVYGIGFADSQGQVAMGWLALVVHGDAACGRKGRRPDDGRVVLGVFSGSLCGRIDCRTGKCRGWRGRQFSRFFDGICGYVLCRWNGWCGDRHPAAVACAASYALGSALSFVVGFADACQT
jgi:POT family proton-dependent oligopeptide transporter